MIPTLKGSHKLFDPFRVRITKTFAFRGCRASRLPTAILFNHFVVTHLRWKPRAIANYLMMS